MSYVIGMDFGTLSGRAIVVNAETGEEVGTGVMDYPHGVIDRELAGKKLPPDFALQDPQDYLDVMRHAIPAAIKDAGIDPSEIKGIGLDHTSATVLVTTEDGTPLNQLEEFQDNPHAWIKLWKHHGGQEQADRIVALAEERNEEWLGRYGGVLSSELLMPKALETLEKAPEVFKAAVHIVNALDWIPWQLTGTLAYAEGDSGYKRQYQDGAYPSKEYLTALNPDFANVFEEKMPAPIVPLGAAVGTLTPQWAKELGLGEDVTVASGNIDAHVTATAVKAVEPGQLTGILGTSVCWVVSGEDYKEVPGTFGIVHGGIVPGYWGFEGGQTAVGDIFAWFVENSVPAHYQAEADEKGVSLHELLTDKAASQEVGEHGLLALDWHNGNRSILADANLSGMILGQTLTTTAEDQYRALQEACVFGARRIIENFEEHGVAITEIVGAGGLLKNEFLMQLYADITRRPLSVATSSQAPALGAAIYAAVAAGIYPDVFAASEAMGGKEENKYTPDEERAAKYDKLYAEYVKLHDYFGKGGNEVMHTLKQIRREATEGK
ncbi:ribulokinase [Tessaracoccus sp. SD287]|uniref:ribulokinase n=1 Tax=Tessaracoccus sp. SD287 TaxID=2782008 RepID=UPI001A97ABAC|nr:ribulokinase [Tessaracoccus sp. SD287]MBO1029885.1 ribulokinase [Tessaracoccus sp. SD287]